MNIDTLIKSVEGLCFVDGLDSMSAFYHAVNRAVSRVRSVFPKVKRYEIGNFPLDSVVKGTLSKTFEIKGERSFTAIDLTSYYFEGMGVGKMTVYFQGQTHEEEILTVEINSPTSLKKYRGFIKRGEEFVKGQFKVKFHGDFAFYIKNLALYDCLRGPEVEDIPDHSEKTCYSLDVITANYGKVMGKTELREEFLGLASRPRLIVGRNEEEISYSLSGDLLTLSRDDVGVVVFDYYSLPESVGEYSQGTDAVDFPSIIADACPYLVASNLLAEDEPELSNKYLSQYLEAEGAAKTLTAIKSSCYKSSNNWC